MRKFVQMMALMFACVATISAQEKKNVCIDVFTNTAGASDDKVAALRSVVMADLSSTDRLNIVDINTFSDLSEETEDRLEELNDAGAEFLLKGDLTSITQKTKKNKEGAITSYEVTVNYSLTLTDTETLALVGTKNLQRSGSSSNSFDEATNTAIQYIKGDLKKEFVDVYFKNEATIKALDELDKKGAVKTLYISAGSDLGVDKGDIFEVFIEVSVAGENIKKKIGEVRIKEVMSGTLSLCDVKSGGKEIKEASDAGTAMSVISRPKSNIFDKVGGALDKL